MKFSFLFPNEEIKNKITLFPDVYGQTELAVRVNRDIGKYASAEEDVILYRSEMFRDILGGSAMAALLKGLLSKLSEYDNYLQGRVADTAENNLSQLIDLKFYTETMDYLFYGMEGLEKEFQSEAFRRFYKMVSDTLHTDEYAALRQNLRDLDENLRNIKSVTLGVNLNAQLQAKESGIVAIHSEAYKSSNFIDRLMRLDFRESKMLTLTPLSTVSDKIRPVSYIQLNHALNLSLNKLIESSAKPVKSHIRMFLLQNLQYIMALREEITFIYHASEYVREIQAKGIPVCFPEISSKNYYIHNIFLPALLKSKPAKDIVSNDIVFDEDGRLFILTGPNSGGKSVFVNAILTAQCMFQLGLPIFAAKSALPVLEGIFTHFQTSIDISNAQSGRLEEEIRRIAELYAHCTGNSLILMDEAFSSTNSRDGAVLAQGCLNKLKDLGAYCIFSTHIHELVDMIGRQSAAIDFLAVEIIDGVRTYKVRRGYVERLSDAQTIAKRYGII